ncbi:MAG: hypothetical protein LBJ00_11205 [Planctomycetaceae bacterium]|nr:hypothetical protein [Planctomycetaceae bacterium]
MKRLFKGEAYRPYRLRYKENVEINCRIFSFFALHYFYYCVCHFVCSYGGVVVWVIF